MGHINVHCDSLGAAKESISHLQLWQALQAEVCVQNWFFQKSSDWQIRVIEKLAPAFLSPVADTMGHFMHKMRGTRPSKSNWKKVHAGRYLAKDPRRQTGDDDKARFHSTDLRCAHHASGMPISQVCILLISFVSKIKSFGKLNKWYFHQRASCFLSPLQLLFATFVIRTQETFNLE